jgi:hypothetical protein
VPGGEGTGSVADSSPSPGSNRNDAIVKLSQPQIASMLASSAIGPL